MTEFDRQPFTEEDVRLARLQPTNVICSSPLHGVLKQKDVNYVNTLLRSKVLLDSAAAKIDIWVRQRRTAVNGDHAHDMVIIDKKATLLPTEFSGSKLVNKEKFPATCFAPVEETHLPCCTCVDGDHPCVIAPVVVGKPLCTKCARCKTDSLECNINNNVVWRRINLDVDKGRPGVLKSLYSALILFHHRQEGKWPPAARLTNLDWTSMMYYNKVPWVDYSRLEYCSIRAEDKAINFPCELHARFGIEVSPSTLKKLPNGARARLLEIEARKEKAVRDAAFLELCAAQIVTNHNAELEQHPEVLTSDPSALFFGANPYPWRVKRLEQKKKALPSQGQSSP
ncbi:hypothetical protein CBOM_00765 [Ceraceosorus bombacis]|uniref:Uncharacterized protein n=1 Tax=Ceraceosorus bombacis TaxID=401625 RepID=A0A0P1BAP5_9BASI|nr:hypothetical protein CBOM_00765 [Ceraceosorus bombacis]